MASPNFMNTVRLVRGQTKTLRVVVKTKEGKCVDITGLSMTMTVRPDCGPDVAEISKSTDNGIEYLDPAHGVARITLESGDTEGLSVGVHRYDVWVIGDEVKKPVVRWAELHVIQSAM